VRASDKKLSLSGANRFCAGLTMFLGTIIKGQFYLLLTNLNQELDIFDSGCYPDLKFSNNLHAPVLVRDGFWSIATLCFSLACHILAIAELHGETKQICL
jgi:hypothetical protein